MNETSLARQPVGANSIRRARSVQALLEHERRGLRIRKAVGDLVRLRRTNREAPLTQEKLAERAGISTEYVSRLENYKAKVSIEYLDRIAQALDFQRLSDFLARDDDKIL